MSLHVAPSLSPGALEALIDFVWPGAQRLATLDRECQEHLTEWEQHKMITRYHTRLGVVIALNENGRAVLQEADKGVNAEWLLGPSAVTDRAYQYEAVCHLIDRGYFFQGERYKRSGLRRSGHTSQINAIEMIPPGYPAKLVAAKWFPLLYATIAQGGTTPHSAKRLTQQHIASVGRWQHPVLIAVPAITPALKAVAEKAAAAYQCEVLRYIEIPIPAIT